MSVFEDKIKRNKTFFNLREPDPGHLERFTSKLDEIQPEKKITFSFGLVMKAAAVLLVLISFSYVIFYFVMDTQTSQANVHNIEYTDEFGEILAYYDAVSLEKIDEIDKLVRDEEKATALKMTATSRMEDLDGSLAAIEKEYQKDPENKKLQAALINNKRKKVEVMDRIIAQLDFANTELY